MKKIILVITLLASICVADTKTSDLAETVDVQDADVLYLVDGGTSKKITVLNLFDTIDTSLKLLTILTNETGTGLAVFATSPTFTTSILAAAQADIGSVAAEFGDIFIGDGKAIKFGDDQDVTLTHTADTKLTVNLELEIDGELDADGIVTLGDGGDNFSVASDGIDIDTSGNITNAGTIASGVVTITGLMNTSVGLDAVGAVDLDYGSGDVTDHTFVSDGGTTIIDGSVTAVTAFIIGAASMSEADLETLDGITPGTAAASKALVLDGALDIATINSLTATTLVGALTGNADTATLAATITVADNEATAETNAILFSPGGDLDGGDYTPETDGDLTYTPNTGTVTATEFSGGGANLTAVDAATGDSATAFFDAGTIEHERGGLQADVSAFTGLIAVTGADTTAEIDSKAELEGQIADVSDFAEADGDVFTGDHDFGGADLELPQGQTPDTDGDVDLDFTDGSLVVQHGAAHAELGGATDVVVGKLIKSFSATIFAPDGVNDVIPVKPIVAGEFPHGIVVTEVHMVVGTDSNYTIDVENWDDFDTINAGNPSINSTAYTAGNDGEVTDSAITFATIAAGQIIMIDIPATDIDWVSITIFYYEPIA